MSNAVFNKVDYTLGSLIGKIAMGEIGLPIGPWPRAVDFCFKDAILHLPADEIRPHAV